MKTMFVLSVCVRLCVSWVIATHIHRENALCFVITCLGHMQRRRAGERPQKKRQRSLVSVASHLLLFVVVVFQLRSRTNLWKEMRIAFVCFLVSHLFSVRCSFVSSD